MHTQTLQNDVIAHLHWTINPSATARTVAIVSGPDQEIACQSSRFLAAGFAVSLISAPTRLPYSALARSDFPYANRYHLRFSTPRARSKKFCAELIWPPTQQCPPQQAAAVKGLPNIRAIYAETAMRYWPEYMLRDTLQLMHRLTGQGCFFYIGYSFPTANEERARGNAVTFPQDEQAFEAIARETSWAVLDNWPCLVTSCSEAASILDPDSRNIMAFCLQNTLTESPVGAR